MLVAVSRIDVVAVIPPRLCSRDRFRSRATGCGRRGGGGTSADKVVWRQVRNRACSTMHLKPTWRRLALTCRGPVGPGWLGRRSGRGRARNQCVRTGRPGIGGLLGDLRLLGQFGEAGAVRADALGEPPLGDGGVAVSGIGEVGEDPVLRRSVRVYISRPTLWRAVGWLGVGNWVGIAITPQRNDRQIASSVGLDLVASAIFATSTWRRRSSCDRGCPPCVALSGIRSRRDECARQWADCEAEVGAGQSAAVSPGIVE
jgi:hypothetical protein